MQANVTNKLGNVRKETLS